MGNTVDQNRDIALPDAVLRQVARDGYVVVWRDASRISLLPKLVPLLPFRRVVQRVFVGHDRFCNPLQARLQ